MKSVIVEMASSLGPESVCIHVEGPDGSGKSTLVPILAARLGARVIGTSDPPTSRSECYDRIKERIVPGVVCDRSSGLVSELVYGPTLRGRTLIEESELWSIISSLVHAVRFIYCRPPDGRFIVKHRDGEAKEHTDAVTEKHLQLVSRYDEVIEEIRRLGGTVIKYDWTSTNVEEIALCVEF